MDDGGAGTINSHWRDAVFDPELMTGFLSNGVQSAQRRFGALAGGPGLHGGRHQRGCVYPGPRAPHRRTATRQTNGQRHHQRSDSTDRRERPRARRDPAMSATWRIGGAMLLAGCSGANAGQSEPQWCAPVAAPAEASTLDAARMGGEYSVRLVASAGAKRGETRRGSFNYISRTARTEAWTWPTVRAARPIRCPSTGSRTSISTPWAP